MNYKHQFFVNVYKGNTVFSKHVLCQYHFVILSTLERHVNTMVHEYG